MKKIIASLALASSLFVDHLTFTVDGMWADAKRRFECATATAAQRAEAFLKTLKLWEHTK